MILKISKLNKIGKFSDINQGKEFYYGGKGKNCNIIFGFNGSGKTTLSNSISFFADNTFITEEEKKEIFEDLKNNDDSVVEMNIQGNSTIKYPSSNIHSKNIYIFNQNFVSTHVFNGTKGNLKKFTNISGEIKNKEIDNVNEQIESLNKEKSSLVDENKKLNDKHEEITKVKSNVFGKTLTDKNKKILPQDLLRSSLSTETCEVLDAKISSLGSEYDLSKKQTELNADVEELRQISFQNIELDFNLIDDLLSKNIQQLSKDVLESKIKEVQNLFSDDLHGQSVERWFKFGKEILENINPEKEKICPICDSNISDKINSILLNYQGYFDIEYENFIKQIKEVTERVSTSITSIKSFELSAGKLEKICIKYQKVLSNQLFNNYDFSIVQTDLKNLEDCLKLKIDNIQNTYSKSETSEDNVINLNVALQGFKVLKAAVIGSLESKKLNTNTIEEGIRKAYKEMILLEFNNSVKSGALEKYKANQQRIIQISSTELPALRHKLSEELKKIKAESRSISKYLGKMGISHFNIDINEENQDENIVIKYINSASEKNKLKNCLSEGEKTALAFAYFLSKFDNEINTEEKISSSVVVIDDPISSLDDNRLYSTAHLMWRNFENVKQLIVMSHNFLFLKYFNSFYKTKASCFFLEQQKLLDLPDELKNFESPYFYMLQNIIDFIDADNNEVTYIEVKKHLPNFIRRVLETFLSFKFSRTIDRKGGHRSPGLCDFDVNIDETDLSPQIKTQLKEKIIEINRIADAHSHGNAHHTQENFYISEADLIELSRNALEVIKTMDNLHMTCFVKE